MLQGGRPQKSIGPFWAISFYNTRCGDVIVEPPIYYTGWWFQPLWKILVSWDYDIPNI